MYDYTSLWAVFQKRKNTLSLLIVALLIFAGGWQLGKIMSPYYAANSIVFEDSECPNAGGNQEELINLQQQAMKTPAGKTLGVEGETPSVEEAGAKETSTTKPAIAGTTQKKFVGSVNSNLFHDPTCSSSKRIKEENKIWFRSQEEAKAAGYGPSKCTQQKLGL